MASLRGAIAALVVGAATALVLLALAILPFLNPVWVGFAQDRAEAAAWTGLAPDDLRLVTGAILADLVLGPPDFDVELDGAAVLKPAERDHMRDVRTVFGTFYLVAAISALVLVVWFALARGRGRARLWRRMSRAGLVVGVATIAGGITGLVFFDTAFQLFHEVFFPQGNFLFDPRTDRLVQLFPEQFWLESTIGVGAVLVVLGFALAWVAGRRAAVLEERYAGTPATLHGLPVG
jgi:integral membrane protein (TIGR01906 family)